MAQDVLAKVRQGEDPAAQRQEERTAPTVAAFCDRYLKEHAQPQKKPASAQRDRDMIRRFVKPKLGARQMADITRADVIKLHQEVSSGAPYAANRLLSLLSKMMNLAEFWGVRPDGSNPCRHVKRNREAKRQRFLSDHELARLGAVWREVERERVEWSTVIPALRLALFTGARIGEVLGLRWEYVKFERGVLDLPDSKTGAKVVHLSPPALKVLNGVERQDGNPFVFYGRKPGAALVNLKDPWARIRKRAEMPELRIHDLRHSFASVGAGLNASLPVIGALLGHTQASTTQRYAHLAADPLKEASERIASRIASAMRPADNGSAKVVELNRKQARRRRAR